MSTPDATISDVDNKKVIDAEEELEVAAAIGRGRKRLDGMIGRSVYAQDQDIIEEINELFTDSPDQAIRHHAGRIVEALAESRHRQSELEDVAFLRRLRSFALALAFAVYLALYIPARKLPHQERFLWTLQVGPASSPPSAAYSCSPPWRWPDGPSWIGAPRKIPQLFQCGAKR
jgi:hypothetical protein